MDNLEKFIKNNRDQFDEKTPSLKVWSEIDKTINQESSTRRISWFKFAKMAAAMIILIGIGAFIGNNLNKNTTQAQVATTLAEISPEHAEVESFFKSQLETKLAKLASFKHSDQGINDDLDQLEELMDDLRKELKESPKASTEQIIEAMIQNYQTRIEILERVLSRIDPSQKKNLNLRENETIDI